MTDAGRQAKTAGLGMKRISFETRRCGFGLEDRIADLDEFRITRSEGSLNFRHSAFCGKAHPSVESSSGTRTVKTDLRQGVNLK